MNILITVILAMAAVFVLWIGLTVVLSLDSAFHETRKAKSLAIDINSPGNRIVPIGHSTVLIQLDGLNIITDPIFSNRILYFSKRYVEPGIPFEKLPKIDAIIISHEHYDHFDKATLKKFDKNIPIVVSKGLKSKVEPSKFWSQAKYSIYEKLNEKANCFISNNIDSLCHHGIFPLLQKRSA